MGPSPELALKELKQDAQTRAENAAEPYSTPDSPPPDSDPRPWTAPELEHGRRRPAVRVNVPKEWRFEVVDIRLAPAVIEGKNGWLAYGTLLSESKKPEPKS